MKRITLNGTKVNFNAVAATALRTKGNSIMRLSLPLTRFIYFSDSVSLSLLVSVVLSVACTDINNIMAAIEERWQTKAACYEKQQPTA